MPDPESDIEIARRARLHRIADLARDRLDIADEHIIPYGHHKAKLSLPFIDSLAGRPPLHGARHVLDVREVRLTAGAEFVVMVCGDIMTMPGLPKQPSAERIDLDEMARVVGLP